MRRSIAVAAVVTAALWMVHFSQWLLSLDLSPYGIFPRQVPGLAGILFAPLIHGSWAHLGANTGPVLILLAVLLYGYPRSARVVIPVVYLGTGLLVWLLARPVYHIGASGLTFGMLFFICTAGVLRRDKQAIALSLAALLLYGGMLGGLAPAPGISFETHAAAAVLGTILGFALRDLDPPPPRKVYSWELEDEENAVFDEDDFIDDSEDEPPRLH